MQRQKPAVSNKEGLHKPSICSTWWTKERAAFFCKNMVTADWIRTLPIDEQLTENRQWYRPCMDLQTHDRGVIQSDRCWKMAHQFGTSSVFCWDCLECWLGGRWACSGITGLREKAQNVRKRDGRLTLRRRSMLLLNLCLRHVYVRVSFS